MNEASPFLQQIVRLYAYADFIRKVARYYKEASDINQQDFLLVEGYSIFQDRWPACYYSAPQVCPSVVL